MSVKPCQYRVRRCRSRTWTPENDRWLVWCKLANQMLGFGHAFPETWCDGCAQTEDDTRVDRIIAAAAGLRIQLGEKPNEKHACMSLDDAVRSAKGAGMKDDVLASHILAAVDNGLDVRRATQLVRDHDIGHADR